MAARCIGGRRSRGTLLWRLPGGVALRTRQSRAARGPAACRRVLRIFERDLGPAAVGRPPASRRWRQLLRHPARCRRRGCDRRRAGDAAPACPDGYRRAAFAFRGAHGRGDGRALPRAGAMGGGCRVARLRCRLDHGADDAEQHRAGHPSQLGARAHARCLPHRLQRGDDRWQPGLGRHRRSDRRALHPGGGCYRPSLRRGRLPRHETAEGRGGPHSLQPLAGAADKRAGRTRPRPRPRAHRIHGRQGGPLRIPEGARPPVA
ncbi:hypothetical protein D9M72_477100 [compost metagenome]